MPGCPRRLFVLLHFHLSLPSSPASFTCCRPFVYPFPPLHHTSKSFLQIAHLTRAISSSPLLLLSSHLSHHQSSTTTTPSCAIHSVGSSAATVLVYTHVHINIYIYILEVRVDKGRRSLVHTSVLKNGRNTGMDVERRRARLLKAPTRRLAFFHSLPSAACGYAVPRRYRDDCRGRARGDLGVRDGC